MISLQSIAQLERKKEHQEQVITITGWHEPGLALFALVIEGPLVVFFISDILGFCVFSDDSCKNN